LKSCLPNVLLLLLYFVWLQLQSSGLFPSELPA
jgi:hypothetical protein